MRNVFFLILVLISGLSNASAQFTAPVLKDGTNGDAPGLYTVGNVRSNVKNTAVYIAKMQNRWDGVINKSDLQGHVRQE